MSFGRPLGVPCRSGSKADIAPRKSKLRYATIDDQFRSGHEGGIVAREEQGRPSGFSGLAETMKRDLVLGCRGRFGELLLGKSENSSAPKFSQVISQAIFCIAGFLKASLN